MNKLETEKQIQETADKIAREFNPEKIILFGSWAWGNPGPDSDVDLFIVKETENSRTTAREIGGSVYPRPFPMDIIVYSPDKIEPSIQTGNFFIRNIVTKGRVLYARE